MSQRSDANPIPAAATAWRHAWIALCIGIALFVAVFVAACFTPALGHDVGTAVGVVMLFLAVDSLGLTAIFLRARGLDRAERRAGYTTLSGGEAGLEHRDRRSGRVVKAAETPALSIPSDSSRAPIRGSMASPIDAPHGAVGTVLRTPATFAAAGFVILTVAFAWFSLWALVDENASGVLGIVPPLAFAATLIYCVIGPMTAITHARCEFLRDATGATSAWSVWTAGMLDDFVLSLPAPGTLAADPTATYVMYLVDDGRALSFWTRRGRRFEQVLWIPRDRLRSVGTAIDMSTGQPQTHSVVTVTANNGETVLLQATAQPTSWRLRAASRDMTAKLAAVAASNAAPPRGE